MAKDIKMSEFKDVQKIFRFNLDNKYRLNQFIDIIEDIILNTSLDLDYSSKYKEIVKDLLIKNYEGSTVDEEYIRNLAKDYNNQTNKMLLHEEKRKKRWGLSWIKSLFKPSNEEIGKTLYNEEELKLFNKFLMISEKVRKHVEIIAELEDILSEEEFNLIKNKSIALENVKYELVNILEELKHYESGIQEIDENNINNNEKIYDENRLKADNRIVEIELINEISNNKDINDNEIGQVSQDKLKDNLDEDNLNIEETSVKIGDETAADLDIDYDEITNNISDNITTQYAINNQEYSNEEKIDIKSIEKEKTGDEVSVKELKEDKIPEGKKIDNNVDDSKKVKKENEENYESLSIAKVFNENIFKMFVSYCTEHDMRTINDLKNFDFNKIEEIKGFGPGKKKKLISRYEDMLRSEYVACDSVEEYLEDNNETIVCGIKDCYKELDISILESFSKINSRTIGQLREAGIDTIDELTKAINGNCLTVPNIGSAKIKHFIDALEKLKMEPGELFEYLIDSIKNNDNYYVLIDRSVNHYTLQEIGKNYNVTRERIRQKEKKIVTIVKAVLKIFIDIQKPEKGILLDIVELLGVNCLEDNDKVCLGYVLKLCEGYNIKYIKDKNKFMVTE